MKKILSLALALSASVLMAQPMGQGMMERDFYGPMCKSGLMEKCQCDPKQMPRALEALELNDNQKEQVIKLREEGQAFHNKQHEKMMAVLTPEQRGKLDYMRKLRELRGGKMQGGMGCPPNGMNAPRMPQGVMGCKNCNME
ncbi:hypothetical protein [Sulfuricurvum sp.]|uniref:hypothetical protein n=1 Tax=Sulfuricurvum sp. TaxID=2025608 RepID=UPI003C4E1C8F